MNRTLFLTSLFISILLTEVKAQVNFNFDISTSQEMIEYEKSVGSLLKDSSDLTIPIFPIICNDEREFETIETTAVIFERDSDSFYLQPHVWYYFTQDSKDLMCISYNWSLYTPSFNANKNRDLLERLVTKESDFIEKFNSLQKELTDKFGEPCEVVSNIDKPHYLERDTNWKLKDMIITLEIKFTREIKEFPGIGLQTNNFDITIYATKINAM